MSSGPIAPALIVLPLTFLAMLPIAAYISVLHELPPGVMPRLRRRVRTTSAWCGLVTVPLAGMGLSVVSPATASTFVIVWTLVGALVLMQLVLAGIDLMVTGRESRELARARRDAIEIAQRAVAEARATGEPSPGDPPAPIPFADGQSRTREET